MAENTKPNVALNADDIASDLERKQSQRLMIASSISIAVNLMFLIGAAKGMEEKPLSLAQDERISYITIETTPAPVNTPEPEKAIPTPAPKQVARVEPKKPETRQTPPPPKPVKKDPVQVAKVTPPRTVVQRVLPTPPPEEVIPDVVQTPPPPKPVEETVTATTTEDEKVVQARSGRATETVASNRPTNASVATNAVSAAPAPRGGTQTNDSMSVSSPTTPTLSSGGGPSLAGGARSNRASVAEGVAGGATNIAGGEFTAPTSRNAVATGAPSLRTGAEGGRDAPGVAGIVGAARNTSSITGSAGTIAGPSLNASSGPTLGSLGGKSGSRQNILTQADAGGGTATGAGDFTVAKGSGLKPGAIVARTGNTAGGGTPGTLSNTTLSARIGVGGSGAGSNGSETLGAPRMSMGTGGTGGGPVGLRAGKGPGASAGDGALAGGAAGDAGGVSARGIAGGNGAPGAGAPRTSGLGGAGGSGEGVRAGARGGVAGLAPGEGASGRPGGGAGSGPGGGDGGPVARSGSGVGAGSGNNAAGEFGVKGGAGNGADVNSKGTGAVAGAGRADIKVQAGGAGGSDIQTTRIGAKENGSNNGPIQVRSGSDKEARAGSAPKAGDGLSGKIDPQNVTAITEARIISRKQPEITEEMKASDPKKVIVEFTVGANGSSDYKIVSSSGNPEVDAAVLKACASFRWKAASRGGTPTESKQRITFDPKG